ncbi:uncharacterized protein LOC123692296 isoform X1 [Colias croceus]|uniref:uncharacterized protein LOC123692296 isoform X1 n=1 Tax=Colias crocea TaxID=72248 RepID=UPI001E27B5F7|nr:uncharacterized protein LOC123692296 isoform X1 [Colias croceus]
MSFQVTMVTVLFLMVAVNCTQQTDEYDDTSIKAYVNKLKQINAEYFARLRRNARDEYVVVSNRGSNNNHGNRGYPNRDSGSTVIILPEQNYDTKYTETTYHQG